MEITMGWREAGMGKSERESCSVVSDSLRPHGPYSPWNSPVEFHYGVGSLSILQGIFPTQGLKPDLPHCKQILQHLRHKGPTGREGIVKLLSCVRLFATPWTVVYQAPPSMGFSRQEYWSGVPFPFPGDIPDPGIEPWSPALQADALPSEPRGNTPKCVIVTK